LRNPSRADIRKSFFDKVLSEDIFPEKEISIKNVTVDTIEAKKISGRTFM
jgi:hypothetical protein